MHQIIEYVKYNPNASALDIVRHFEHVMEIPKHLEALNTEVDAVVDLRKQVRPLYAKRLDVEEKMKYLMSDIEMEVYLAYPPRQGTDAQREVLRNKLKQENPDFVQYQNEFKGFTDQIQDLEEELKMVELATKAARRVTEMFGQYVAFITEFHSTKS